MRLSTLAGSIQILATGLIAGIFIAIAATEPSRTSLGASSFVQLQQGFHITFARMMPPLVLTAILAGVVWMISLRKQLRSAAFLMAAISTAGAAAAFILTITFNFPINDLLMTWNSVSPPINATELWMPWERTHLIRTVIYLVSFVSAIAANNLSRLP